MATQTIKIKRNTTPYANEAAAYTALNTMTLLAGEPVVLFYNTTTKDTAGKGGAVGSIYAVGTTGQQGAYQAFATWEDMYEVYQDVEAFKSAITVEDDEVTINRKVTIDGDVAAHENSFSNLLLPTSEPSNPSDENGYYMYIGELGDGSDTPSGGGGADLSSLVIKFTGRADETYSPKNNVVTIPSFAEESTVTDLLNRVVAIEGVNTTQGEAIAQLQEDLNNIEIPEYTIAAVTPTDENVMESYQLQKDSTAVGPVIKIYKDSALKEVYLGSSEDTINATTGAITKKTVTDAQSLNFAYMLSDGTYTLTKIDVSKFLTQSEFGNGLAVSTTGVVSVKVDNASQANLSVGADGLKLTGVAQASDVTTLQGRKVSAGVGLTGGGDLSSDRSISLGKPSTITDSSTNSVSGTTHTHEIDEASTSKRGIVQLNDNTDSNSTTQAATANAVKKAYDKANSAQNDLDALEVKTISGAGAAQSSGTLSGGVTITVDYDNTSIKYGADKKLYVDVIDGGTF